MKRLAAISLAALLLTGCAKSPRYHYDVRQDLGIYFTNADAVIEQIRGAMRRRDGLVTITYQSHRDNMEALGTIVRELMECALSETDSPEEGDYLRQQYGGYDMHYSYRVQDGLYCYEITITPQYYTTAAQEEKVTARVQALCAEMDGDASDLDKVKCIYELVKANTRYDEVHAKNPNHHLKTTAYAALIQGQAVCQGYAVAMYRLLRECGVNARVITGTADGEPHAWNLVELDGVYYNLDVTWDDERGTQDYFLKSDADFTDHTRDAAYRTSAFYDIYPMAAESWSLPGKEQLS